MSAKKIPYFDNLPTTGLSQNRDTLKDPRPGLYGIIVTIRRKLAAYAG